MKKKTYPAVMLRQTPSGPPLVLFGASAHEIVEWAGIPQKTQLGSTETTGFQREVNHRRLKQLKEFYADERNIVQNPLLCATRSGDLVRFTSDSDDTEPVRVGTLELDTPDFSDWPLLEICRAVKEQLEERVPSLRERSVEPALLQALRDEARVRGHLVVDENDSVEAEGESDSEREHESDDEAQLGAAIEDESHILEFYDELSCRVVLLEELKDSFDGRSFLGYASDALTAYLKPVLVVDGQHRLEGAVAAALDLAQNEESLQERIAKLVDEGVDPGVATERTAAVIARKLPVSLLLTSSPAEHVFQFVIVNQKATPISRPLLGTIISTTLANDELRQVSQRLQSAGIALEDSRAIASLSRDQTSPFYTLVERGLSNENGSELLTWSVFGQLVRMFRDLRGGKLYGERNDYADKWRRSYLGGSAIVSEYETMGYETEEEYWRAANGPWRRVFVVFWTCVRDFFSTVDDPQAFNYWGNPRTSNLFNKISLTILGADFFQCLCEVRGGIESEEHLRELFNGWLDGVNDTYFARDWNLSGVKKDSTGIRNQWAATWVEYRKDPERLPRNENYRKARNAV